MKPEARNSVLRLCGLTAGMFVFGFALGPLYSAICEATGFNGKFNGMVANAAEPVQVDSSRTVKVQFVTTVNGGRDWKFHAEQSSVEVHPGEFYTVNFYAENTEDHAVVAQAVPNIAPWNAASHLRKTECFCFNNQPFKAGEGKKMPVRFMLDPALPKSVDEVTLSYTFFDVTDLAQNAQGQAKPRI